MRIQSNLVSAMPTDTILSFTPGALYSRLGLNRLAPILSRTNVIFLYEQQLDLLLGSISVGPAWSSAQPDRNKKIRTLFEWRKREGHVEPIIVVIKPSQPLLHPEESILAYGREDLEKLVCPDQSAEFFDSGRAAEDTTGAGDALAAGVLFGILSGCDVYQCTDLGFELAMRASGAFGARVALPTREDLRSAKNHG
jgi:ribokinase